MAARVAEGSDYLKIVYDHWAMPGADHPYMPTLALETVRALIAAAHARSLLVLVLVHVGLEQDAFDVVEAGADGLAHLWTDLPARPELIARMQAQHTFVVATLSTNARACEVDGTGTTLASDPDITPYLTDAEIERLRGVHDVDRRVPCFDLLAESIRTLHAAGVPILRSCPRPRERILEIGLRRGARLRHRERGSRAALLERDLHVGRTAKTAEERAHLRPLPTTSSPSTRASSLHEDASSRASSRLRKQRGTTQAQLSQP